MKTTIIVIIIAIVIGSFLVWKVRYLFPAPSYTSSKTIELNKIFVFHGEDRIKGWYWGSNQYPKKYTPSDWQYNEKYQVWYNPGDIFNKLFLK